MSKLAEQIKQAVGTFAGCKTPPVLIGGVALAAHAVRGYFALFDRTELLDEWLADIADD